MDRRFAMTGSARARQTIAIGAVLAAMTLVVLDAGIANLALPTIGQALGIAPGRAVLVITAYQAGLVVALLPCVAAGERFGYRPVFALGVGLFVFASALCALAPSLPWLAAARLLQGVGGAAVMALGVALMRHAVAPDRLGAVIGWNAMTVALASAAAPSLGALVLSLADWRWIYALNLPLGALVLVAARRLPQAGGAGARLDMVSMALSAATFGGLVAGAEMAPASPLLAGTLFVVAGLALVTLVRRELSTAAPLIPLDLLRGRTFRVSVIASVCCFAGQTAGLVALAFHLQQGLGQTPLIAGLYLTAWPLSVALAAAGVGRAADRLPTAWLCAAGGSLLAIGLGAAAVAPLGLLVPCILACGLGFGLFQTPNNRNLFLSASPERSGAAGGMQGTARLTGQTAGALLMTALFHLAAIDAAPRVGLGMAAIFALAASLVSLFGRRSSQIPRPLASPAAAGAGGAAGSVVGAADGRDAETDLAQA
ncbi:MAG: hypothetical protein JWM33_1136 [Caulobacteraceae bacterium]|nr:hypothetical protein [Caulobacteraceae bacterium]